MSLSTNISNAILAIAADIKALAAKVGNLNALTTTAKGSLVDALNEVRSAADGATGIDDGTTSSSTTWSSSKIGAAIAAVTPSWGAITGKPTTFPPTIGTTGTTAKAGDYVPSWSEIAGKPSLAAVATSGSYADLTGVIPSSALPPLAVNETFVVSSASAMTSLAAQRGDMAIRTDAGKTFVLSTDSPGTLADWKEISASGAVASVAGKTGTVVLAKADVGLASVDNTSDASKPISTATQTALNAKASIGTVAGTAADAAAVGNTNADFVALYNAAKA